jgi:hypothetical protein
MVQNEYYSSVALSEHVGAHDLRWAGEKKGDGSWCEQRNHETHVIRIHLWLADYHRIFYCLFGCNRYLPYIS